MSTCLTGQKRDSILELVLDQLEIPKEKCVHTLAVMKEMEDLPGVSALVFPEISKTHFNKGEIMGYDLDAHIVFVNHGSWDIALHYHEPYKTIQWDMSAVHLYQLDVDPTFYRLSCSDYALGVYGYFANSSRVDPYYSKAMYLFILDEDTLNKVLHAYPIEVTQGTGNGWDHWEYFQDSLSLELTKSTTNFYRDIKITNHKKNWTIEDDDEGNRQETMNKSVEYWVLRFDGKQYGRNE